MGAGVKIVIGLILTLVGLGLFADEIYPVIGTNINWIGNFVIVLTGVIPILLILLGLFIVWLEADELKVQKELSKETKETKPEKEEVKKEAKK